MLIQESKMRKFVKDHYDIDESKLTPRDVRQLCEIYLRIMENETPMVAQMHRDELGIK